MRTKHKESTWKAGLVVAVLVAVAIACQRVGYLTDSDLLSKLFNFMRTYIYIGLFAVWGVSVSRRVVQVQVRRILMDVAALMVFWLVVREYKFRFVHHAAALRYLWYLYYVPLLLIPLCSFLVSLSLGKSESFRLPGWTRAFTAVTVSLLLLVLTNDIHQRVFRFPSSAAVWTEHDYRYGVGFVIIACWGVLCALLSLIIMVVKSRVPGSRRFLWLPLIVFGAAVLYVVLYAIRIPFIQIVAKDLAVFDCLVFTGFFESCIRCGLIQTNTRYLDLFLASEDIDMQIVDESYEVCFSASGTARQSKETMERAQLEPVILLDGRSLHNMKVSGGYAVWTEDTSGLLRLREKLCDRQEELQERNAFLQYEYEREKEHKIVEEQNRLFDLLQSKTQSQLAGIDSLMQELKRVQDRAARRRILSRIVVLGSFIKRRKDFVLSADGTSEIPTGSLASAFGESFRALRLLQVGGACYISTKKEMIPGETAMQAYDFFEDVMEGVLDAARYLNVSVCEVCGELRIRIFTDCDAVPSALLHKYPGLRIVREEQDGTAFLLPLGGGGVR